MAFYEIIFSPTGGTEKVADIITGEITDSPVKIDLCMKNFSKDKIPSLDKKDCCIVAVPSFGGRVPAVNAERLRMFEGNGASAFAVVVYGNRAYEDTMAELYDILAETGFRVREAAVSVAEHSIFHSFAHGRPDSYDVKKLENIGQSFLKRLGTEYDLSADSIPGNRPYKEISVIKMIPAATDLCNRCSKCSEACPVGAIPQNDPSNTDKTLCISCMRCVSVCRYKARTVPEDILKNGEERLKKLCAERKEPELFT